MTQITTVATHYGIFRGEKGPKMPPKQAKNRIFCLDENVKD